MNAKKTLCSLMILAAGALVASGEPIAEPMGTAFTYQGELEYDGIAVTDTCDFEFSLWNDPESIDPDNQVGDTRSVEGVEVIDGRFTVVLDFGGDISTGDARWLGMAMKCSDDDDFIMPSPREELMPAPYAAYTPFVDVLGKRNYIAKWVTGSTLGTSDIYEVPPTTLPGGGYIGIGTMDPSQKLDVRGTFIAGARTIHDVGILIGGTTIKPANIPGGGDACCEAFHLDTMGGADLLLAESGGNVGIGASTPSQKLEVAGNIYAEGKVASGGDIWLDGAIDSVVTDSSQTGGMELRLWGNSGVPGSGVRALRLEAASAEDTPNVIGGYSGNGVMFGVIGATIGGGGSGFYGCNSVMADLGTVGGGCYNIANGWAATVPGG